MALTYQPILTSVFNEATSGDTDNRDAIAGRSAATQNYPIINLSERSSLIADFFGNFGNVSPQFSTNTSSFVTDSDYFVIDIKNDGIGSVLPGDVITFSVTNQKSDANIALQWRLVDESYLNTIGPYGKTQFYLQYSTRTDNEVARGVVVDRDSNVDLPVPGFTDTGSPLSLHSYLAFQIIDYNTPASAHDLTDTYHIFMRIKSGPSVTGGSGGDSTDLPDTPSTPGRVAPGGFVDGTISPAADRDSYATTLTAGQSYVLNLEGSPTGKGTLPDPYLRLSNSQGTVITQDDDSGVGTNARIVYTPTTTGTYFESAGAHNDTGTGTFRLSVGLASTTASVQDTFRFFDTHDGGHFFTTNAAERDQVLATRPDLRAEGIGFEAFADARVAGSVPIFRFFDTHDGGHFFTANVQERDAVLATRPDLKFEGVGYYEFQASQGAKTDAVYRFFDTHDGGHFFTSSTAERDAALATRPDLHFEGIAFYAPHPGADFVI